MDKEERQEAGVGTLRYSPVLLLELGTEEVIGFGIYDWSKGRLHEGTFAKEKDVHRKIKELDPRGDAAFW
jgi:hypothetical protein